MKKKNCIFRFIFILGLFSVLSISCVSTQRPFRKVYQGETEQLIGGTRWELIDLRSSDNFTLYVEFSDEGTVSWYNIPERYNAILSEKSTWERNGDDLVFNSSNGYYLYEGKISIIDGQNTVAGQYKTGYRRPLRSHPVGNFSMIKQ